MNWFENTRCIVSRDVTLDTIHFSTENTSNTNENKNTDSPFPLTQITPKRPDKDPTLVTNDLENNKTVIALPFNRHTRNANL